MFIGGVLMVLEKVAAILEETLDVNADDITLETRLQEDLDADSIDAVDIAMSIEDEFKIEVPDEVIENMRTVSDIVDFIENA